MVRKRLPLSPIALQRARALREDTTEAERVLWARLRNRSLMGVKFRRQHVMAGFLLDFYCHQAKLAVELDGGQHDEPEERMRDVHRDAVLQRLGITTMRFWNNEVLTNLMGVLETIRESLSRRGVL